MDNLRRVFGQLRGANFKLAPEKCQLFQKEINYLGFIISAEGVRPDPEKVKAVREWKTPTNLTGG